MSDRGARRSTTWSKPFWDATLQDRFLLQASATTGKAQFFPRGYGLESLDRTEWTQASGAGTLLALTICRTPSPGFEDDVPYAMGIVKLAEGPRVLARLALAEGDALDVGDAVQLTWRSVGEGRRVYLFEPARHDDQR